MIRMLTAVLIIVITAAATFAQPPAEPQRETPQMLKAVIHINFGTVERQESGLRNVENILKEVPEAQIAVVCHSSGISLLLKDQTAHADQVRSLAEKGVQFLACQNTLKRKNLAETELLPGVTTVPSGAVEILRKQQQGFGYFRP